MVRRVAVRLGMTENGQLRLAVSLCAALRNCSLARIYPPGKHLNYVALLSGHDLCY